MTDEEMEIIRKSQLLYEKLNEIAEIGFTIIEDQEKVMIFKPKVKEANE